MVGSIIGEGVKGMQQSQREMQRTAQDITKLNVDEAAAPPTANNEVTVLSPVAETEKTSAEGSIAEPLVELKRQEQVFNASAKIVSMGDDVLGSLINVKS